MTLTTPLSFRAMATPPHLVNEVGEEGVGLILGHPVVVSHQHVEQNLEEVQTLEVDSGVGVKEPQSYPAQQQVQSANGRILKGRGIATQALKGLIKLL